MWPGCGGDFLILNSRLSYEFSPHTPNPFIFETFWYKSFIGVIRFIWDYEEFFTQFIYKQACSQKKFITLTPFLILSQQNQIFVWLRDAVLLIFCFILQFQKILLFEKEREREREFKSIYAQCVFNSIISNFAYFQ